MTLHDGGVVRLHKLAEDYDPTDRVAALHYVQELQTKGEIPTGLIFLDGGAPDLHERMGTPEVPLNRLGEAELCPGSAKLEAINTSLR